MSGTAQKIGERIYALRKARGMTQEALGERLGVSGQAVSKWEKGGIPDTYFLPQLAEIFSVTTDELLGIDPFAENYNKEKIFALLSNAFIKDSSEVTDGCFEAVWAVLQGAAKIQEYSNFSDKQAQEARKNSVNSEHFTNEGLAYLSFSKDFPFLWAVKNSDKLTERLLSDTNLWRLLDDLGSMEFRRLLLFSQSLEDAKENLLTVEYLSETLDIPSERLEALADKLVSYSLMKKHTAKINGKTTDLYKVISNPYILPMLMLASLICPSPDGDSSVSAYYSRSKPYFDIEAFESAHKDGKI